LKAIIHLIKSVEHLGTVNLLQTCDDYGEKYGKFDTDSVLLFTRKALSCEFDISVVKFVHARHRNLSLL